MADDRRLPVLKLIQPALASFPPYIGQEPPDDYLDKVVQSWAFAEGHMTVSVANIPPVFSQLETDSRQLQNKLHSDNDSIRAEIKSMIKSELALVPTPPQSTQSTSQRHEGQLLRPSQMEPGKIYRDPHLRLNDQEWLRMDDATDRLSALAGPSYLQTFMDTISKEVMDRITPFLPNKKNNTPNNDDMDEITKGMSELSINKAIAKGISQGIKAVHDNNVSSRHRCSNCYSLGHNSRKCPYPRKRNRKNRKSRSKKRGSVNKSGSKKRQSLESPIQRSSQKIQKKSGTIIDSQIRKIILAMFNDPEVIETIKNNINNTNLSMTRRVAPKGPAKPDFTAKQGTSCLNYREPTPEIPESDDEEETLNDPMEIDFVRRKEPTTSLATIPVKIRRLKIPAMCLDSGAEPAIVSEDIVKRVNWPIDKSEKYDLSGVATVPTKSIGIARNFPITFPLGFTIREDFVVVRPPKPTLIFPNPLLKKYKCAIDWGKDELKIPFNGKDHIIPVTMHKVKNNLEVNCATASQNDKSSVSDQISQETDSDKDDNITLEEWHAPVRFIPDSDDSSLAEQVPKVLKKNA
ncbi:5346_t:CDS:2 [Entrophospora sp. SA101]|nr:5346_t:CDS:2 [Entrophospora sp. SA101]